MKQTPDAPALTVEQWRSLVEQGVNIPLTIPIMGNSMSPVIRYENPATIVPLKRAPQVGDIVLMRRHDGLLVVHRVWKILEQDHLVQTWGDNCRKQDKPIPMEDVLGLVVSVKRKGREVALDTEKQRRRGILWMKNPIPRQLWMTWMKVRWIPGMLIRRVWPDFHKERK